MTSYNAWSNCEDCGFQGMMEFCTREDEKYDDPDALGVMLDCVCPACGARESVLVVMEEYQEMMHMTENVRASKAPRK